MVHPPDAPSTAHVSTPDKVKETKIIDILVLKPPRSLHAVSLSLRFLMMDGSMGRRGRPYGQGVRHLAGSLHRKNVVAACNMLGGEETVATIDESCCPETAELA